MHQDVFFITNYCIIISNYQYLNYHLIQNPNTGLSLLLKKLQCNPFIIVEYKITDTCFFHGRSISSL